MKRFRIARHAMAACIALAVLTACSASSQPMSAAGAARLTSAVASGEPSAGSWMKSDVAGPLLYISDAATNEVRVYTWPALTHSGTLTGFSTPFGECADAIGNVWIVNVNNASIVKYAHGGTLPVKTLKIPGAFAHDCSVDPKSGDIAVAVNRFSGNAGGVAIFKPDSSVPAVYTNPAMQHVTFLAYDGHGNLFLDGESSAAAFAFALFKNKTFFPITISGATVHVPGGVTARGIALTVGDLRKGHPVVYELTESGVVTGTTTLDAEACAQYTIARLGTKQVLICPNFRGPSVDIYDFPAGGSRFESVELGLEFPFGSVISP